MITLKRQPVCILVKTDEVSMNILESLRLTFVFLQINNLFHMMLYVRDNEETTCAKIVHFVDEEFGIPSELEANARSRYLFCKLEL